ncbi:MAG: FAD-binding oxidoreductase [Deltaproteobacteria bacterium CG11_big_fil_rev_8_21_14_0_20_45_16]|nr:MAG: FAD-binding oxidoreductase [Deltaproteobacteria bacterium CG11_big_fil_rev_8_21_14_0_20_45_16]
MTSGFENLLRKNQVSSDPSDLQVYAKDWTNYFDIKASVILFPESTEDIQKIVLYARENKISLVPSGGRTGLSGGAVASKSEAVVSLQRMKKIISFSEADQLVHLEAGVITEELQNFAEEKDLYFPIEFASTGSSQIGGNIATNAGGIHVLKYGNTRNWVAGLKVVTGSGEILDLNHGLIKNATGFDLRHLFIGSEGSLGFITEAWIRLTRRASKRSLFLVALQDWSSAIELYASLRKQTELIAFEAFTNDCLEKVVSSQNYQRPFSETYPLYVIFEAEENGELVQSLIEPHLDSQLILDATTSTTAEQSRQIWSYRENISESLASYKPYKNDISVLSSQVPEFISEVTSLLESNYRNFEVLWFGHIGDGNLHINILKPDSLSTPEFINKCKSVDLKLFECVKKFHGSISAEHGVGLTKKAFLNFSRSEEEIEIMRKLKRAFDPDGIMNPGKIFD